MKEEQQHVTAGIVLHGCMTEPDPITHSKVFSSSIFFSYFLSSQEEIYTVQINSS